MMRTGQLIGILFYTGLIALLLNCARGAELDPFLKRLEDSPRHHEWVSLEGAEGKLSAFVVYPEVSGKAPAVLVIHENRGLNDWVRSVADKLAENGYIAIAPDLLSGKGPGGGKTADFASSDDARNAIYKLDANAVTINLQAAANYVKALPSCNGKLAVGGFCWGGSQTFRFATDYKNLSAACVFYGTGPNEGFSNIDCPVYGFYGGNDNRVNATIEGSQQAMKKAGKEYQPVIYEGAQHAFMRRGELATDEEDANRKAQSEAWKRWLAILRPFKE